MPCEQRDVGLGRRRSLGFEEARDDAMEAPAITLEHAVVRDVAHDCVHEAQTTLRVGREQLPFLEERQRQVDIGRIAFGA